MPTTAYVTHPDYRLHTLTGHPEHAGRIIHAWDVFEHSGILDRLKVITPAPATPEQITRVHKPGYVELIRRAAEQGGGMLDPDTYLLPISYDVACLSAGGPLATVDMVLTGQADNGLALVRPPGHHATPEQGMGFCIFNNIAIAACHALATYPAVKKIMIADYDVHHGNGTQDAFYSSPDVLFISSHQYPYYPGTGALTDTGAGPGLGSTINMPLPAGVGNDGFKQLYERVVWPAARRFHPDLILVSAGFDAHWHDPLAGLTLDLQGYATLTRELISMARELCEGRIIFVLEGGYDLEALSHGLLNIAYALQGEETIVDPLGAYDGPAAPVDRLVGQIVELHKLA